MRAALVARREIRDRTGRRAFRVSIVVLLLLAVGGSAAAALTGAGDGPPTYRVGLVGPASRPAAEPLRAAAAGAARLVLSTPASARAARDAVRAGDLDAALVDGREVLVERDRSSPAARLVGEGVRDAAVLRGLRAAGLDEAQARRALAPPAPSVVVVAADAQASDADRAVVGIGLLVLYLGLLSYGIWVAYGVVEEKASRVVELVLVTVRPRDLLAGKVLGLGLLGLGQLVLLGGAAYVTGLLAGGAALPGAAAGTLALVVLWFVLGYALYAAAFAALGSLVSRQEDAQSATAPLIALLVGSYLVATAALTAPDGSVATVASYLPPFAPLVVPARVVLGGMGPLGLLVSAALTLAATAALVRLAAAVYARTVLRTGAPVRLRAVLAELRG